MIGLLPIISRALCALGELMNDKSCQFLEPVSSVEERAFWFETIDAVCAVGSQIPVLAIARALARSMIVAPSLSTLISLVDLQPDRSMTGMDVWVLRQLQALYSKRENIPGVIVDKEKAALDSFWLAERKCAEMNHVLRNPDDPYYKDRGSLIFKMSRKISEILGPCPSLSDLSLGFGPGANVGCKKNTSVKHKLEAHATATRDAGRLFTQLLVDTDGSDTLSSSESHYHAWPGLKNPVAVRGSQWTSVPKSFKTNRGINIEPIINSFIQKGIGSYIRQRLQRSGINLRDQTANQRYAREGSLRGDDALGFCTIDLSMASDTIAYNLVMDLLPWDWFNLLDAVRCAETQLPCGGWVRLEKFSSMGNGFTFELESLIFYALLLVTCGDTPVSVYGDDMVCQNMYYDPVCFNLALCGFIPNKDKSFASGPFRESCGSDFWNGTEVRPVFCKADLCAKEIFRLHNYFVRRGWVDPSFMIRFIPSSIRFFGPDGYGDGHLLGDSAISYHKGYQCLTKRFKSFAARPRKTRESATSEVARYGSFLYGNQQSSDRMISLSIDDVRSSSPRYVIRTLRVPAVTCP